MKNQKPNYLRLLGNINYFENMKVYFQKNYKHFLHLQMKHNIDSLNYLQLQKYNYHFGLNQLLLNNFL